MIRVFLTTSDGLAIAGPEAAGRENAWIDLLDPSPGAVEKVARLTGIELPTRDEMDEIEPSNRLYQENGVLFLTATLPQAEGEGQPQFGPVTFALSPGALVTLRYHSPGPFETYPARAGQGALPPETPAAVLLGLLDAHVDRIADLLEGTGEALDAVSREIFAQPSGGEVRSADFQRALTQIGRKGDFVARLRHALVSLDRLFGFAAQALGTQPDARALRAAIKTQRRDIVALTQHADALTQQTTLLIDATLGLINIEQASIIKIFSVVAFVMLPPTLIASIYGMNFEHMPELASPLGYPLALAAMVVSGVLPYFYFKRRGWL